MQFTFQRASSLKSIKIPGVKESAGEKVSLASLAASPSTANKRLFLNQRPAGKDEARVTEERLIIPCQIIMKDLTRLIFRLAR